MTTPPPSTPTSSLPSTSVHTAHQHKGATCERLITTQFYTNLTDGLLTIPQTTSSPGAYWTWRRIGLRLKWSIYKPNLVGIRFSWISCAHHLFVHLLPRSCSKTPSPRSSYSHKFTMIRCTFMVSLVILIGNTFDNGSQCNPPKFTSTLLSFPFPDIARGPTSFRATKVHETFVSIWYTPISILVQGITSLIHRHVLLVILISHLPIHAHIPTFILFIDISLFP